MKVKKRSKKKNLDRYNEDDSRTLWDLYRQKSKNLKKMAKKPIKKGDASGTKKYHTSACISTANKCDTFAAKTYYVFSKVFLKTKPKMSMSISTVHV